MKEVEAINMATQLLNTYGSRGFEISMPDKLSYDMMREAFHDIGRQTEPDGEFFIIKVLPGEATPENLEPVETRS